MPGVVGATGADEASRAKLLNDLRSAIRAACVPPRPSAAKVRLARNVVHPASEESKPPFGSSSSGPAAPAAGPDAAVATRAPATSASAAPDNRLPTPPNPPAITRGSPRSSPWSKPWPPNQRPKHPHLGEAERPGEEQIRRPGGGEGGQQAADLAYGRAAEQLVERPPHRQRDRRGDCRRNHDAAAFRQERAASQKAHPPAQQDGEQDGVQDGHRRGRGGDAGGAEPQESDVERQV